MVDNPRHIRPAGLNAAIAAARGEIIVRVDARTALSPDYVERCVEALERSGAAIVGGQMRYEADNARQRGIVAAMTLAPRSRARRPSGVTGGEPRFVDTVYLGAFRANTIARHGRLRRVVGRQRGCGACLAGSELRRGLPRPVDQVLLPRAATGSGHSPASSTGTATTGPAQFASTRARSPIVSSLFPPSSSACLAHGAGMCWLLTSRSFSGEGRSSS